MLILGLKGLTIVFVIFHVIVTVSTHLHVAQWWIQGGHPPAPYFWIKLRPEGPKKSFETWPPLYKGMDLSLSFVAIYLVLFCLL